MLILLIKMKLIQIIWSAAGRNAVAITFYTYTYYTLIIIAHSHITTKAS